MTWVSTATFTEAIVTLTESHQDHTFHCSSVAVGTNTGLLACSDRM